MKLEYIILTFIYNYNNFNTLVLLYYFPFPLLFCNMIGTHLFNRYQLRLIYWFWNLLIATSIYILIVIFTTTQDFTTFFSVFWVVFIRTHNFDYANLKISYHSSKLFRCYYISVLKTLPENQANKVICKVMFYYNKIKTTYIE